MSVLTHTRGRAAVTPLPQNVCGFNSETWKGNATPWDQAINWPVNKITSGPRTISWNVSWGSHFSDTEEFRYWITKPGFQYQVGKPLTWADFDEAEFCSLKYNDATPGANPDVIADKGAALFHTRCTVPPRTGRHVIYGEWGRNQFTLERFHGCIDVSFDASTAPDFSLATATTSAIRLAAGGPASTVTINISRMGGFADSVSFSAAGLPPGVTASFRPTSSLGASAVLTLEASVLASAGTWTIPITGTSGTVSKTTTVRLEVTPSSGFLLSAASGPMARVPAGSTLDTTIQITRLGGFSSPVDFQIAGLPPGVQASFAPASATGDSTVLTLNADVAAMPVTADVTITGLSGTLIQSLRFALTVDAASAPSLRLTLAPASISLTRRGEATATVNVQRSGGFSGPVTFSASDVPTGIGVSFSPETTDSSSTTVTLSASDTSIAGAGTVIIRASGSAGTASGALAFNVAAKAPSGSLTAAPVVVVNQPWYNEQVVRVVNTAPLTALSVEIRIRRTPGITFAGQYNSVGGTIVQAYESATEAVIYRFSLKPGQTLPPGSWWSFAAQASGTGTAHPTSGDTFTITYTMGGVTSTESGTF